eukprot:767433-Hanusia_phi.AAC.1
MSMKPPTTQSELPNQSRCDLLVKNFFVLTSFLEHQENFLGNAEPDNNGRLEANFDVHDRIPCSSSDPGRSYTIAALAVVYMVYMMGISLYRMLFAVRTVATCRVCHCVRTTNGSQVPRSEEEQTHGCEGIRPPT